MESQVAQLPLTDRAWAWIQTYPRQILWGAVLLIILGIIVAYVIYAQGLKEVQASEMLSRVQVDQTLSREPNPQLAQEYLKVAAQYPNSKAGAQATLLAGADFFTQGNYERARAQFQKFARDHRDSPFMSQAMLGLAACFDAEGKSDEAIARYRDVVEHHPSEAVVGEANFALGRLYEAQNKPELARDYYQSAAQNNYGSISTDAGLCLEELKDKHPELFQAPAPQGSASAPFTVTPAASGQPTNPPSLSITPEARAQNPTGRVVNPSPDAGRNTPGAAPPRNASTPPPNVPSQTSPADSLPAVQPPSLPTNSASPK